MMHDTYVRIDGSLRIPDHKPDIKEIVQVTSTPMIIRIIVKECKVIFYGEMYIRVKYSTSIQGGSQSIRFKVPFTSFIEHCHARSSMHAKLSHIIEIENFFVRDCRLISKFIFLKVCVVDLKESCTIIPDSYINLNNYQSLTKQNSISSAVVCNQCKQTQNSRKGNNKLKNESNVITTKET